MLYKFKHINHKVMTHKSKSTFKSPAPVEAPKPAPQTGINTPTPATADDYNQAVANDPAVEAAKGVQIGESQKDEIKDTPENNEILKEDEKMKEDVASGEKIVIGDIPGYNQSVVNQPLVPDYNSNRPVYPTNEAYMLSEAAKGNLSTDPPSDKEVREINKKLDEDKNK